MMHKLAITESNNLKIKDGRLDDLQFLMLLQYFFLNICITKDNFQKCGIINQLKILI